MATKQQLMDDEGISTSEKVKVRHLLRVAGSLAAGVLFHGWYPPSKARVCPQVIKSFDEMGLRDDLLRGIFSYGFEKPSAIQQRALLPIVQGRDVIAQAQSGTGKSSLIAMSIAQKVDTKQRE
jgi:hypothetical protein